MVFLSNKEVKLSILYLEICLISYIENMLLLNYVFRICIFKIILKFLGKKIQQVCRDIEYIVQRICYIQLFTLGIYCDVVFFVIQELRRYFYVGSFIQEQENKRFSRVVVYSFVLDCLFALIIFCLYFSYKDNVIRF